jgi:hypothetical protein
VTDPGARVGVSNDDCLVIEELSNDIREVLFTHVSLDNAEERIVVLLRKLVWECSPQYSEYLH